MSINFIPNDPGAGAAAPLRVQNKRRERPSARATVKVRGSAAEGKFAPGTPQFLFWQSRESALATLEAWEAATGTFKVWQGKRRQLPLEPDAGVDLNAFYDRASFSFFHQRVGNTTVFSGASTDVVSHEVGHGLLDAVRPELWDTPFLEAGALHEAFGDCMAIVTALSDDATRAKLLAGGSKLRARNFVESTAEDLSGAIRKLAPNHNAATPRRAFNKFQYQIPETLPDDGGPGELINEVHSFGMIFSGCFYELIANLFNDAKKQDAARLLEAARTALSLVVEGVRVAPIVPRYTQAVGRAMVLADQRLHDGAHRELISDAFQRHGVLLGSNAMLAPVAALAGAAPSAKGTLTAATRKDVASRLQSAGGKTRVERAAMFGERIVRVTHERDIDLGGVDRRLKGVSVTVQEPVLVGASGERAAIVGHLPEPIATEDEVQSFVQSLLSHGQIALGGRTHSAGRGAAARHSEPSPRTTHEVRTVGSRRQLARVRFCCRP